MANRILTTVLWSRVYRNLNYPYPSNKWFESSD